MISIKIECECGQHYAFDAEPAGGRMTSSVACPACGADGTAEANAIIASRQPPVMFPTAPLPPSRPRMQVKLTASDAPAQRVPAGVKVGAATLGLVNRETAETQARANISWGDSPDAVVQYLMLQGFGVPEAQALVKVLIKERLAALRVKGIRKIVVGVGLMCVPVIAWGTFAHFRFISLKLMGLAVMAGLWGVWQVLNGILLIVAPKMESGDVAAE